MNNGWDFKTLRFSRPAGTHSCKLGLYGSCIHYFDACIICFPLPAHNSEKIITPGFCAKALVMVYEKGLFSMRGCGLDSS